MKTILYIILGLFLLTTVSFAGDETAASCSRSDVQTALDACVGGGGR